MITGYSYFKFTIKSENGTVEYMVRSDKVSDFVNNKIDYWSESVNITITGRFSTHKDSRKWFQINNTIKK